MVLLSVAAAWADSNGCLSCCQDRGIEDCSPELRVVGDRSSIRRNGAGFEVTGLWLISCEGGARFLSGAVADLYTEPVVGQIVGDGISTATVSCFGDNCAMPAGLCVGTTAAGYRLVDCESFGPVTDALLGGTRPMNPAAPPAGSGAYQRVVVDGHTVYAARADDIRTPAPPADAFLDVDPLIPTEAAPVIAGLPSPAPDPAGLSLPTRPQGDCRALSEAVAAEARRRVDAGDDRRMAQDFSAAFAEYRAAATMDPCSPNAWVGIAQSAMSLDRADLAVRALRVGTELSPRHYGAWALLGQAYEALMQRSLAHEAYVAALDASPYYPDAVEGEARTR